MDWRKYGQIGYKMVVGAAGVYMAWMLLRVVMQVFFFALFSIPSDSMEPDFTTGGLCVGEQGAEGGADF